MIWEVWIWIFNLREENQILKHKIYELEERLKCLEGVDSCVI